MPRNARPNIESAGLLGVMRKSASITGKEIGYFLTLSKGAKCLKPSSSPRTRLKGLERSSMLIDGA
ncbi:hypothetical protein [Thioalkalivibrio sp. HK1]|uniref:hypothetical protein n=1 Tax=Thioalkalivibrio sp. HK1 TaxID=1469245 RepID=UPI0004B6B9D7|nr:hypothetical protein [Thioalkalivibrio sp. HK1]